jgi:hypothetical protein
MSGVGDLAVLAIPAMLVTGLVLVGLGSEGRGRGARSWRWAGRFQDWATQAGVRGGSGPGMWPPCAAGRGWPPGWPCGR